MRLLYFAEAMLRHPIVIIPPALVFAILCGTGKALGLPRLFWNERWGLRFYAGLAATLLAAEAFLVSYLLDGLDRRSRRISFFDFLVIGVVVWLALVGWRSLVQGERYRQSKRPKGGIGENRGIAPAIRRVDHEGLSSKAAVQVPAGALMAGAIVGALIAFLLVSVTQTQFVTRLMEVVPFRALALWRPLPEPELHLLAAAAFVLLLSTFVSLKNRASPAVGLCVLLALGLAIYTAAEFWAQNAGLALLMVGPLLWWAGGRRYKLRIPALSELYAHPVPYPPTIQINEVPEPRPLPYDVALSTGDGGQRRLIVVCASGGGLRAATWTAAILGQLDEIEGFRAATRLLSGASGGMMGAASWVALLAKRNEAPRIPAPRDTWQELMNAVAMDDLTPLVRKLVFHDIPLAFIGRDNLQDRALALESAWCENLKARLDINLRISFNDLRRGEASGQWPSLVFSPMLIEDGRRLIVSNLDLTDINDHYVRWLSSKATGPEPTTGLASRTAYQLWQICPQAWGHFPLSTAARLSAAFPYVSPAVLLPTQPRRHVVDAGYYDNYGLELAGNWLRELLEQRKSLLEKSISGILLIQIRDNVSELSVNPESDRKRARTLARERRSTLDSRLSRSLEGLSSPPEGFLAARESVMLFRNDSLLETMSHLYTGAFGADFLTTTVFEFGGEASLSWQLAAEEVQMLRDQAASPGIQLKLQAIKSWLHKTDYWAREPGQSPSV
jgi:hypothetical protein